MEINRVSQSMTSWLVCIVTCAVSLIHAQDFQVTFTLVEEQDGWTYVGNVSTAPGFMDFIPVEDRDHLLFSFLQQTSIKSMLSVGDDGALYTTVVVDRESLVECRAPPPCVLKFDIAARSKRKDSSLFEIISVSVIVKDINDNFPIFPLKTQDIEISELAGKGSSYLIHSAEDADTGTNNSIQYYELEGYSDVFTLDVERKLDGSLSVKLVVLGKLDRETKDSYICTVYAHDGGIPAKTGSMRLNITIKDENDNSPELSQTAYNITIKENSTPGTGILQIQAVDADIGDNGKIEYRFSPNQNDIAEINNIFSINEVTGVLSVIGDLVYEPGKNYKVIVEAIDKGTPPLLSQKQAIITVNVEDSGNNPPFISINLLSTGSGRVTNVSEGAGKGAFVAHVEVDDKDTGQNGVVSCSVGGSLFGLESLPNKGFKVVVKGKLDRETQDIHTVTVTCRDHGIPALTNSSSFLVRVTDENDNAPVFSQQNYVEEIYENNKIGAVVISVVATDSDIGPYGDVFYYLDPVVTPYFRIDPNKGTVKAMISFDRENKTSWTFKVFAADLGKPSQNGSASVLINILDRNDNAPNFNVSVFNFSVPENCPSGKYVNRLIAYDNDTEENGIFTFAISDTSENDLPFFLFPDGVIKTNQELDREQKQRYEFTVIAIDKGVPKKTSSVSVVVSVEDENDEVPVIEFPNVFNDTVIIPHLLPIGTFITKIEAYDADLGENRRLSYFIAQGNSKKLFSMNTRTGELTMARRMEVKENREETFLLTIEVHDGGVPQQSVQEALYLVIRYSNATLEAQQLSGEDSNSHIAIVIVVIVITVFLSAAIIVVICLIRKFDRDRLKSHGGHINKLHNNLNDAKETNQNGMIVLKPYDKVDSLKKKKEVSFSFEDDLDGFREHEISFGNNSVFGDVDHENPGDSPKQVAKPTQVGNHERPSSHQLKTFQIQQNLLSSAPKHWPQGPVPSKVHEVKGQGQPGLGHPEDNHSDTSRETVTSDSGRGGSEDELPVSSHNCSKDERDLKLSNIHRNGGSSQFVKCSLQSVPHKNRHDHGSHDTYKLSHDRPHKSHDRPHKSHDMSHDRPQSTDLSERIPNKIQFERSLSNLVGSKEPKFSVRRPYIDREVRDKKAQSESWVPSYV